MTTRYRIAYRPAGSSSLFSQSIALCQRGGFCSLDSLVYGQASIAISGEIGSDPGQSKTAPKGLFA
jgi:hypothetical protein